MKLLIIGNARHGKDTLAEIFSKHFNVNFESSSHAACRLAIYPVLKEKYNYSSMEECFLDRVNHRKEWYDMICDYNRNDPSRLTKDILSTSDIYVGLRSKRELDGSRNLFDLIIFVDASSRLPLEGDDSCTISRNDADIIIENNLGIEEFEKKSLSLGKLIFK